MSIIKTIIKQVDSEFDDIYRITTDNGLILDISENEAPIIGSIIEYTINNPEYSIGPKHTIMNGTIFSTTKDTTIVSFGGLMGTIPSISKYGSNEISLSYCLVSAT
jgi:hypothetical protein